MIATATTTAYYTQKDFENIIHHGINCSIPQEVIRTILELEARMKNKAAAITQNYEVRRSHVPAKKRDWVQPHPQPQQPTIVIKPRVMQVKEGKEKVMQRIQVALNKLTKANLPAQIEEIQDALLILTLEVDEEESDAEQPDQDQDQDLRDHVATGTGGVIQQNLNVERIMEPEGRNNSDKSRSLRSDLKKGARSDLVHDIYNGCIRNMAMGDVYSDLYIHFLSSEAFAADFRAVLDAQTEIYRASFEDICYVDPEKDNDGFCLYTKKNTLRRSVTKFMVRMMQNGVVPYDAWLAMLQFMVDKVDALVQNTAENRRNELEEVTENLFVAVTTAFSAPAATFQHDGLVQSIQGLSKVSVKEKPNMTSRAKFKYQDMAKLMKN